MSTPEEKNWREKEHETDMPHCWCNPEKQVMPNGNILIIHKEKTEHEHSNS